MAADLHVLTPSTLEFEVTSTSIIEQGSQKKTVYNMVVKSNFDHWNISYRYSDFFRLYEYVTKNYKSKLGTLSFPDKKLFSHKEKVVQERCLSLPHFFNELSRRVQIVSDEKLCSFFQIPPAVKSYILEITSAGLAEEEHPPDLFETGSPDRSAALKRMKSESDELLYKNNPELFVIQFLTMLHTKD